MPRTSRGYAVWSGDGRDVERRTFTCCHCNNVVIIPARSQATDCGGFCTMCNDNTCKDCATKGGCEPFEKKLEAMERRGRLLAAVEG